LNDPLLPPRRLWRGAGILRAEFRSADGTGPVAGECAGNDLRRSRD